MPTIKAIAGAAGAVGVLAIIAAAIGGEPETVEPVAASITAPLLEQPKAPPASTTDTEIGHEAPTAPPPKAGAPRAANALLAELA